MHKNIDRKERQQMNAIAVKTNSWGFELSKYQPLYRGVNLVVLQKQS